MKRIAATLLILFMLLSPSIPAKAATTSYTTANTIADVCFLGYNNGYRGSIMVSRGTLTSNGSRKPVYIVCLSDYEYINNQATWLYTDVLACFKPDNEYLKVVVDVIKKEIPKGSNLFLAGHSLGGMIVQQVAADDTVKADYHILNTVTFGSPLVSAGSYEGTMNLLADTSDPFPFLSPFGTILPADKIDHLNCERGNYGTNIFNAHYYSYRSADVWGSYDVTGTRFGSAKIAFDRNLIAYYRFKH